MRFQFILLAWLIAAPALLSAAPYLAGLPVTSAGEELGVSELSALIGLLTDRDFGILHYDRDWIITVVPPTQLLHLNCARPLAAWPAQDPLYLVGKLLPEPAGKIDQAGRILLDLESSRLLESRLDLAELQELTANPVTPLPLGPLRISRSAVALPLPEARRNVIGNLTAAVNADSILVRLQALQNFQTRRWDAPNRLQVAEWIRQRFLDLGLSDAELQPFTYQSTTQYNVTATLPGTLYPDEFIIVGGHHDSTSRTTPLVFAPGADDNASGAVAALEMARVLTQSGFQPKCSIRFVTFAAEEAGLWGSKHYAQNALDTGQNIRLMINHDMIANEPDSLNWQIRLMPYAGCYDFSDYATQVAELFSGLDVYYDPALNSPYSDSHPFWTRGFKVVYFFEHHFSPYYHSADDIIANLNPAYCAEAIRASLACAVACSDLPSEPVTPQNFTIANTGGDFLLSWDAVDQSTLGAPLTPSGYNVYSAASPEGPFQLEVSVSGLSYLWQAPEPLPPALFFRVSALRD